MKRPTTHNESTEQDKPAELQPSGQVTRRRFLGAAGGLLGLGLGAINHAAHAAPSRRTSTHPETLDYMIAQMLMVGFAGSQLTPSNPVVRDIGTRGVGGVYLIDYTSPTYSNVRSPAQVKALTTGLQALANDWPLPLLVATDQEGGSVVRLKTKYGFPGTVTQQYLGSINNLRTTHSYAQSIAKTMASSGLNLNFAPVVDVNTNPYNPIIGSLGRSFSANPSVVISHALEVLAAHREQGVLCTLKHFPGHGSSRGDSHLGFVDVSSIWSAAELQPFRGIVAAGKADVIMTAHIFNSHLDPTFPATLSRSTVTGLLREQLGYDGVVISDDLQMKAVSSRYTLEQALRYSINAGVDMFTLIPVRVYQSDLASRPIAIIKALVQSGAVSQARIEQSYERIKRLKGRL